MVNYFEYYGLPIGFHIDLSELRRKYYAKSKELHPDQNGSDSMLYSSINNQAYQCLLHPVTRLKHCLELEHIVFSQNSISKNQEFLMEMLDYHEEIQSVIEAQDEAQIEEFKADWNLKQKSCIEHFKTSLDKLGKFDLNDNDREELVELVHQLNYLERIKKTLLQNPVEEL